VGRKVSNHQINADNYIMTCGGGGIDRMKYIKEEHLEKVKTYCVHYQRIDLLMPFNKDLINLMTLSLLALMWQKWSAPSIFFFCHFLVAAIYTPAACVEDDA
jgi:hypothetical protein